MYGRLPGPGDQIHQYIKYYDGDQQKFAFSQAKYKSAFRGVFETWRDNFCGTILDSTNERLHVEGFRLPGTGTDQDAREFWQRSSMDSFSSAVHLDALITGKSFVLVWADKKGEPIITPVSSQEMVVQYKPGSLTELEAAARFYMDSWGRQMVTLWTEEYVYEVPFGKTEWESGTKRPNPLNVVPVVPFYNRARLGGAPMSDLQNVIPIQDAINKTLMDALTTSEAAAFPLRTVTGLEIQLDDAGNPIQPFDSGADKILQAEDPQAKFGTLEAADLGNYAILIGVLLQHLGAISRTPPHYFLVNGGSAPSGESILGAEAGLVAKVKERMLHFGECWERVIRLCFAVKNDDRRNAFDMETQWRDPEYRTEAQHIDALLKMKQLNVPEEFLWAEAGFTATQIAMFREMRKQDAKAEAAIQRILPQPQAGLNPAAAKTPADKPPPSNSGNANRKINERK
ncbi:hypothetical protein STTU_0800 [Streptomyces sp. Tu6071]|nr:hypothetical protein STTU_0800 [Streptomyces sp. Tu6071]